MEPEEIIQSVKPFTDLMGCSFTCVGFAGHRYGPTLIWQMRKPSQTANIPKVAPAPRPKAAEPSMASYYRDNRDGTVTNVETQLQWMRFSLGQEWKDGTCVGDVKRYTWQEALDAADALNRQGGYAGYQDWRVPTKDELETLLDSSYFVASIDPVAFPKAVAHWYWSSSTNVDSPYYAWRVNFYGSHVLALNKAHSSYVRLVRGQAFYGLHSDTDHRHLHLMINRVHPATRKLRLPNKGGCDLEAAHRAIARIEHAQGWQRELQGRYRVRSDGQVWRESPLELSASDDQRGPPKVHPSPGAPAP